MLASGCTAASPRFYSKDAALVGTFQRRKLLPCPVNSVMVSEVHLPDWGPGQLIDVSKSASGTVARVLAHR